MERETRRQAWNRAFKTGRERGADHEGAAQYADQVVKGMQVRGELASD